MKSNSEHWDAIFTELKDSKLGWYEKDVTKTLGLLNIIEGWDNSTIFVAGAGTSVLIDELLSKSIKLVLNDISIKALNRIKERLKKQDIFWLRQDISQKIQEKIPPIDIWIDRAVLHFLIDDKDIRGYFRNLKSNLKLGGYTLLAEFSRTGAIECADLPIHQYSINELQERLGNSFELVSYFHHTYINPNGDEKPYIYSLFRKIA